MKPWILDRLLWMAALGATMLTIGQTVLGSKASRRSSNPLPAMRAVLMYNPGVIMETADSVASTDPFRLDRHPSSRPPLGPATTLPSAVSAPLHLTLTGISGGPPWHAIVSGIPGHDGGVVVNTGDTLGGVRIGAIKRDTVIVQMGDSTLTFTLRR
jgi:hypothetical protein